MFKYKVTFDFDIEKALDYDESEQYAEVIEIDDDCFDETFNDKNKIKEFEDWYNNNLDDSEQISIVSIHYDREDLDSGFLNVTLNSELKNPQEFANELVEYLFEGDYPQVEYNVTGESYEDYWDYARGSHGQRSIDIDDDKLTDITSYSNVKIVKE